MPRVSLCVLVPLAVLLSVVVAAGQSQVVFPTVVGFLTVEKWRGVDIATQVGYVMGAADALSVISTHLNDEQKLRILRTFGDCASKMRVKGYKVEKIHALTRDLIKAAPKKFQVPRSAMEKTIVAGWVELAVVDACP